MLSEAKHLSGIAWICGEMLHSVQHDNAFAVAIQRRTSSEYNYRTGTKHFYAAQIVVQ
jgi:hypothetical protein